MIEARQLEGNDINPVVRVTIGNKRRQTRVRQSTNRPYYNQVSVKLNITLKSPDGIFNDAFVYLKHSLFNYH